MANRWHPLIPTLRQLNAREYQAWASMRDRCNTKTHAAYHHYGGRGIKVCKRWDSFEAFLSDMGECPKGKSLERLKNNKGYSPSNCVWATHLTQMNNTRRNKFVTFKGETLSFAQWSKRLGLPRGVLRYRLSIAGWSVRDAMTTIKGNFGPKPR